MRRPVPARWGGVRAGGGSRFMSRWLAHPSEGGRGVGNRAGLEVEQRERIVVLTAEAQMRVVVEAERRVEEAAALAEHRL